MFGFQNNKKLEELHKVIAESHFNILLDRLPLLIESFESLEKITTKIQDTQMSAWVETEIKGISNMIRERNLSVIPTSEKDFGENLFVCGKKIMSLIMKITQIKDEISEGISKGIPIVNLSIRDKTFSIKLN